MKGENFKTSFKYSKVNVSKIISKTDDVLKTVKKTADGAVTKQQNIMSAINKITKKNVADIMDPISALFSLPFVLLTGSVPSHVVEKEVNGNTEEIITKKLAKDLGISSKDRKTIMSVVSVKSISDAFYGDAFDDSTSLTKGNVTNYTKDAIRILDKIDKINSENKEIYKKLKELGSTCKYISTKFTDLYKQMTKDPNEDTSKDLNSIRSMTQRNLKSVSLFSASLTKITPNIVASLNRFLSVSKGE